MVAGGQFGPRFSSWWFQVFFYVQPCLGMISILTNIFSKGLKPPTSPTFFEKNTHDTLENERLGSPKSWRWMVQTIYSIPIRSGGV